MSRPSHALAAAAALAASAVAAPAAPAAGASPDVVVSEVYGGGGNSGATLTHDFVELYNGGNAPADVTGWSVQYASAGGDSWAVTRLTGTIAPGSYYLVQEAQGSGGTTALPAADATGSTAMSSSHGKVALVTGTDALTCATGCATAAGVRDLVGYGSDASAYEGSAPAAGLTSDTSDSRQGQDTDDNAADFLAGTPTPMSGAGQPPAPPVPVEGLRIHDVQGAAQTSPYDGKTVAGLPGVVTARDGHGFWIQDDRPDADPATSEGLYVYTGKTPTTPVGARVAVTGQVQEYRAGSDDLSTTELDHPTVSVQSTGVALPAATLVGPGGRVPPGSVIEDDATGAVEQQAAFDPAEDGIDFWESLEGMRVSLQDAQVVGPRSRYGELPVVPAGSGPRTRRGGVVITRDDLNPERVILDDVLARVPAAQVGDTLAGTTTGVLDYSFSNFKLLPTTTPTVVPGGLTRETTRAARHGELSIASYNVENLDPTDPAAKFDALADQIVHRLQSPDIIGVEEVQDNDGAADSGTVAAGKTLRMLTDAIAAAGGPSYSWRQIDPVDDAEGGEPGGNIRVALLFREREGLRFVDRGTPSSTEGTEVAGTGRQTHLTRSPGRIDPGSPAWEHSRVPLVGEFTWQGRPLFVVANHFASKGGDDPLFGRWQPPVRGSEEQRHAQAHEVRAFVDDLLRADPRGRVAVLGDLNDFDFSKTADILVGSGRNRLTDLPRTLPLPQRYTYVYEGNSQVLDHVLLSRGLRRLGFDYDVVHVNAEFVDQTSDHDPQVVRIRGQRGR